MYIRKQKNGYAVEVKRKNKRYYKGNFKSLKAAKEWGASKEK